jgi:hypothetical protein
MKAIQGLLLCIVAILSTESCTSVHDVILQEKDAQFFKVEELPGVQPIRLRISGLAFNSAMSVSEITTKADGSTLVVLVHLALTRPGTSGSFVYELAVPETVSEVRFGNSAIPVWKRESSPKRPRG